MAELSTDRVALIVGVTGIIGLGLARKLLEKQKSSWSKVYGVSRRKQDFIPDAVEHVSCDLRDSAACATTLRQLNDVTHVFYATWMKGADEEENIKLNTEIMRNLLENLSTRIRHFVLVTGTKHYMGPHSAFGKMGTMVTPWRESHPRLDVPNFYYNLEDLVFEAAEKYNFAWTVARPHIISGFAPGNAMNMGTSIAVYASLCKHLKKPLVFPGCKEAYTILLDSSDTDVIAEHLLWEVNTPKAANQAFNVTNGDQFRWRELWKEIAEYFQLEVGELPEKQINWQAEMAGHSGTWEEMVRVYKLRATKLEDLATWWLLEVSMSRTQDCFADMMKSRELGFHVYRNTAKCFFKLFDELRNENYIPKFS